MKKLTTIVFVGLYCVLMAVSCNDYDSPYTENMDVASKYDGTLLEYLEEGSPTLGVYFDSMLVVINSVPGMRELLDKDGEEYTIFAIPNESFEEAINRLNLYRINNNRGGKIFLNDLLIDPFVVTEEIPNEEAPGNPIIIEHRYDYRLQMDSLLCRYIYNGSFNSAVIKDNTTGLNAESFKYRYVMNIEYKRLPASGIENVGNQQLILSDMNDSQITEKWDRSNAQWIDIRTKNGYIHILSTGHEFSFSELISRFQNYGNEQK
jgi:hypothetical protein